ncbi:hypothetical protein [Geopseudomonas aromaticivorans]
MKKRVKTPATPFDRSLLAPGREEEAVAAIAERYRLSMEMTLGRPFPLSDGHSHFAHAILQRNARAIEHLANGLNDVGKKVFVEVTGIELPPQQGRTWEILRNWGGITAAEDALYHAERRERIYRKDLDQFSDPEKTRGVIEQRIMQEGLDRIVNVGRKYLLVDAEGNGIDLSTPGSAWGKCRDYLETVIELKRARAAVAAEQANLNAPVHTSAAERALDAAREAVTEAREVLSLCHGNGEWLAQQVERRVAGGYHQLVCEGGNHALVNGAGDKMPLVGRAKLTVNARAYAGALLELRRASIAADAEQQATPSPLQSAPAAEEVPAAVCMDAFNMDA